MLMSMPESTGAVTPTRAFDPATVDVLLAWQALEVASKQARDGYAAKAGVSPTDFQALVFLSGRDGMAPKDLGAVLGISTGAMTALIDRLEDAGHLSRQPHPTDRRSTRLFLTPAGSSSVAAAGELYVDVVERIIPQDQRIPLVDLFRDLAAALQGAGTARS